MGMSLREMQQLAGVDTAVEDTRRDLGEIVQFFKHQEYHDEAMEAFIKMRKLPRWLIDEADVFFVDDLISVESIPEKFRHESLGLVRNGYVVYEGRIVYPVKDVKGQVMGFCGWDAFARPKYLDSLNSFYKAKETTFYGMEKLPEYYTSDKPIYAVEGIVCCLYLRSVGLQAIALLGSSITRYVIEILKRIQNRLIVIPDNDNIGKNLEELNTTRPAGEHLVQIVKRNLPRAIVVQSKIAKDIDDTRKYEDGKYEAKFVGELKLATNPYLKFETIIVR